MNQLISLASGLDISDMLLILLFNILPVTVLSHF